MSVQATPSPAQQSPAPSPAPRQDVPLAVRITRSSALTSVLAVVVAIVIGGLLIAVTDQDVQEASAYFFARPMDTIVAAWKAAAGSYVALFQGSVYSPSAGFKPLTETLVAATPLICAGLGVALAFRAGLFNIGAQGQIIFAGIFAGYAGFAWHLPWGLHLLVVLLLAALAGGFWGGIAGWLKATTGAHEVIVTIMLNYVALYLVSYLLNTPAFLRPGETNPITPVIDQTAQYPNLIPGTRLHAGFIIAILLVIGVAWLLNRSTLGFELRAVGENPAAARTAGINVKRTTALAMVLAGILSGFAASSQVAGSEHVLTGDVAGSVGFDAITVALLGRSTPWGTFFAGLLFGAFSAGARTMQIQTGTPIDIVLVVQSLIVLFIAAPPLVRSIFGLNRIGRRRKRRGRRSAAAATEGGAA